MQVIRRVMYSLFCEILTKTKFEFFIKFREIPVISFRDVTHEQGTDGLTDRAYYWLHKRM